MLHFLLIDKNINIINQVISSTSIIITIVDNKTEINDVIFDTFNKILNFLRKLSEILPEIVYYNQQNKENIKQNIIDSLDNVINIWNDFPKRNKELIFCWFSFTFWWEEYQRKLILKNENSFKNLN